MPFISGIFIDSPHDVWRGISLSSAFYDESVMLRTDVESACGMPPRRRSGGIE